MKRGVKVALITSAVVGFGAVAPIINSRLERVMSRESTKAGMIVKQKGAKLEEEQNTVVTAEAPKAAIKVECREEDFEPKIKDTYGSFCSSDTPPRIMWKVSGRVRICSDGSRTVLYAGDGERLICTGPTRDQRVEKKRADLVAIFGEEMVTECFNPRVGYDGEFDDSCKEARYRREDAERYGNNSGSSSNSDYEACFNTCYSAYVHGNQSVNPSASYACQKKCR